MLSLENNLKIIVLQEELELQQNYAFTSKPDEKQGKNILYDAVIELLLIHEYYVGTNLIIL